MLTVLSVAYSHAPVGPDAVGGAEQVLSILDAALTEAGHRSIVIGCEGSRCRGKLVAIPRVPGLIDDSSRAQARAAVRTAIARVIRTASVDVIHMHGFDFAEVLPVAGVPVLVTLHLPPGWYRRDALHPTRPDTWLHCVSASQHAACPQSPYLLPPIANGVELHSFGPPQPPRAAAVMLGRICPEKGQHLALWAAHAAGVPLVVAGQTFGYPEHIAYLESEVRPRLDADRCLMGPVGGEAKRRLLAQARCVLIPSLAPETSSLVAMEALASGTPVIAFPSGALAEIVEDGLTGFLARDVEEMAERISDVARIDSATCRDAAEGRFDAGRMIASHFERYRLIAARMAA